MVRLRAAIWGGVVALAVCATSGAVAEECHRWPVDPSISLDGRSVLATPKGFGQAVPFFIANAHLPNPDSSCRFEELRAVAARAIIVKLLSTARSVSFCTVGETDVGFLAHIVVDGKDLSSLLVDLGLAYKGYVLPIAHWCRHRTLDVYGFE